MSLTNTQVKFSHTFLPFYKDMYHLTVLLVLTGILAMCENCVCELKFVHAWLEYRDKVTEIAASPCIQTYAFCRQFGDAAMLTFRGTDEFVDLQDKREERLDTIERGQGLEAREEAENKTWETGLSH